MQDTKTVEGLKNYFSDKETSENELEERIHKLTKLNLEINSPKEKMISNDDENNPKHHGSRAVNAAFHRTKRVHKPVIHHKSDIMRMVQLEQRVLDLENQVSELKRMIVSGSCKARA